jgi:hypothetical protein
MPRTTSKSAIFAKYGTKLIDAHQNHVGDETELGFVDLPAGINNGTARLVDCRFGQYKEGDNKGEWFFMARASVRTPEEHDGMPVRGLFTQIGPEPICDTPTRSRKTVDDHIKWVYDQFDLMGLKREDIDPENLEETAQIVKEARPTIRFRTWKGAKQTTGKYANQEPRVQHQWLGLAPHQDDDDPGAGVDDDGASDSSDPPEANRAATRATPGANGNHRATPTTPAARAQTQAQRPAAPHRMPARPARPEPEPEPETNNDVGYRDDADMASLVERAAADDNEAILLLSEFAVKAGYTEDEVSDAKSWDEVVDMINNPRSDDEPAVEDETSDDAGNDDVPTPAKGESWSYRPRDKKGNPGKAVPVEVVKVDTAKGVCDVRSFKDNTVHKAVPFEHLEQAG